MLKKKKTAMNIIVLFFPSVRVCFHFGKGKNHLVELGASVGTFLIHLQSKGNPDPEGKKGVPFLGECVACHPPVLDRAPSVGKGPQGKCPSQPTPLQTPGDTSDSELPPRLNRHNASFPQTSTEIVILKNSAKSSTFI
jgi:hypothetical protein